MSTARRILKSVVQVAGVGVGVWILLTVFRGTQVGRVAAQLAQAGWMVVLVPLPFTMIVLVDTMAWRELFRHLYRPVSGWILAMIRVSSEAVVLLVPGGVAVAEALKPLLLRRADGVEIPVGAASVVLKKSFIAISQGTYVLMATIIGIAFLVRISFGPIGHLLPLLLACVGAILILIGLAALMMLTTPGGLAWYERLTRRLPGPAWKEKLQLPIRTAHTTLMRFRGFQPHVIVRVLAAFIGAWIIESLESFLFLSMLSPGVSIHTVFPMEITVSLMRSLAFVMPGGVGVQEFGYLSFLTMMGVPDPLNTAAAFSLLKRGKELLIVLSGGLFLALMVRRSPGAGPEPVPAEAR